MEAKLRAKGMTPLSGKYLISRSLKVAVLSGLSRLFTEILNLLSLPE